MANTNYTDLLFKDNFISWINAIASNDSDATIKTAAKEISTNVSTDTAVAPKPYYNALYNKYQFKILSTKINGAIGSALYSFVGQKQKLIGTIQKNPVVKTVTPPTPVPPAPTPTPETVYTFGVLGDSGMSGLLEYTEAVATQIQSYNPQWVVHVGDANYSGAPEIWTNFLNFWVDYDYANNIYLAFGNHDLDYDYGGAILTALEYTTAAAIGPEKQDTHLLCYDFVRGPVHFFVFNTGNTASGDQMDEEIDPNIQLQAQIDELEPLMLASTSPWKVVVCHKPPYTSEQVHREGAAPMRLDYAALGIDIVLSGHSHDYEVYTNGGIQYFVQGLGGASRRCVTEPLVEGYVTDFCQNWGYSICNVTSKHFTIATFDIAGYTIDVRSFSK